MKKRFYKNSLSGVLQLVINLLITFYVLHVFISKLGTEIYGVYSVISIIGNLNILVNFGFNTCLLKFLSEQGKSLESDYDIVASTLMLLIILIPFTLILFFLKKFVLLNIFNIPINLYNESDIYMNFMVVSNCILLIGQLFTTILDSMQVITITNMLQLVYNILYWGGILIAIFMNRSLPLIGLMNLFASIIWFILVLIFVYKMWGKISINGFFNNFRRIVRKQLSYSLKIYLSSVTGQLIEPLSKIIISNLFSVKEVGFYDLALKIKSQIINVIQKGLYPLLPYLASINDKKKISEIIEDIQQKIYISIIPLTCIVLVCSYSFVNIWIGDNVFKISVSIQMLVSSYLLFSVSFIPVYYYFSLKHVMLTFYTQLLSAIVNAIILFISFKFLGYYSILLGNGIAIFSTSIFLLYYQFKKLNTLTFTSLILPIKLCLIFIILVSIGFLINLVIATDIIRLIINPLIIVLLSLILFKIFRIFKKSDFERYFNHKFRIILILENYFTKT